MSWIDDPARWDALAARLGSFTDAGIDTELTDWPDKTSPQYRARIHCWSLAVPGSVPGPRGYRPAGGVVLPRVALEHPPLIAALRRLRLWAHNAPVDEHGLRNEGVDLELNDTLQWARVAVPGMASYGLKDMRRWALGKPERPGFKDMVRYRKLVTRATTKHVTACACGARPCRKPSKSTFMVGDDIIPPLFVLPTDETRPDGVVLRHHVRSKIAVVTEHEVEVDAEYAVGDFVPGAQLAPLIWRDRTSDRLAAWWEYSVQDAVDGIELVDWLNWANARSERPGAPGREYPWRRS